MKRTVLIVACIGIFFTVSIVSTLLSQTIRTAQASAKGAQDRDHIPQRAFEVDVLIDGQRREEYSARGKTYIEALPGREYEIRLHNPLPYRVAVAVSVDGLNSIDARHTSAWNASKWVIGPYQTINLQGWQMSSNRARRFYFTSERDSYAAKLGQAGNLGVISAVFFRERVTYPVPVTPPPRPRYEGNQSRQKNAPMQSERGATAQDRDSVMAVPDDEYAATGIGRSVEHDVRWISMDLERDPAAEVTLRYEYYPALVKLGILPRRFPDRDPLSRREESRGFEERRYSPEP